MIDDRSFASCSYPYSLISLLFLIGNARHFHGWTGQLQTSGRAVTSGYHVKNSSKALTDSYNYLRELIAPLLDVNVSLFKRLIT